MAARKKRSWKVWVWRQAVKGKTFLPSHVLDAALAKEAGVNPRLYRECVLTLSPSLKKRSKPHA